MRFMEMFHFMSRNQMVFGIVIVACGFGFVKAVIKMFLDHSLKMEKIKRGYPVDEINKDVKIENYDNISDEKEYLDYTGQNNYN